MASVQHIRKRIGGIAKTKQITRSMRMVSFSKVQRARAAFDNNLPYYRHAMRIMDILASTYTARRHRLFVAGKVRQTGILAISTDRGLCGAYNMNIVRRTARLVREKGAVRIISVGSKSAPALAREDIAVDFSYIGISETPIVEEAEMLSEQAMHLFLDGEIDELYLIYHRFENMLSQRVVAQKILPFSLAPTSLVKGAWSFEPDEEQLVPEAAQVYLTASIYNAMLESALCEQGARVNSMDAAARNSDELLEKLKLQFNKLRQELITNEIIEIVSGAASQTRRTGR